MVASANAFFKHYLGYIMVLFHFAEMPTQALISSEKYV